MPAKKSEAEIRAGLPALMPRLWRYGLVLSGDPAQAQDLAQATALRALERAAQFAPGTRLDRWCFSILVSIWKNDLRARKTRIGNGEVVVEEAGLIDNSPAVEVNILANRVLSLTNQLPEGQRMAIFLVYVEGHSYAEAAAQMEIPIGTVMSRLANGRKRLKQAMGEDGT
ncbi:MAG: RNA polymerase sigma factor [Pseudomonadota bacterium]